MIKYIKKEIHLDANTDLRGVVRYTFQCPECGVKYHSAKQEWIKNGKYETLSLVCKGCGKEFQITKRGHKIIDCEEVEGQLESLKNLLFLVPTAVINEDYAIVRRLI